MKPHSAVADHVQPLLNFSMVEHIDEPNIYYYKSHVRVTIYCDQTLLWETPLGSLSKMSYALFGMSVHFEIIQFLLDKKCNFYASCSLY